MENVIVFKRKCGYIEKGILGNDYWKEKVGSDGTERQEWEQMDERTITNIEKICERESRRIEEEDFYYY